MSRKLITFDQVLLKLPKNKVIQTSELLKEFPGMKMPALTSQLMRLTSKDLVEKLGASTYRVSDNRPYYRVSKYIILPLDLFELIVSYLREGVAFRDIHVITGIPMESVKFVNKTLGGKIKPRIETKSSVEQARAKLNSATKEELDEIEEVEEGEIVQPTEVETKYFAVSVQGINLKVEEGLHMKFEDGTVYISR